MGSHKVKKGINDLKTWALNNNAANLLDEWDSNKNRDINPEDIAYGSNRSVWWLCPNKHSYSAKVGNRTFLGRGCPYCSNHSILEGFNDFKTWCKKNGRNDLLAQWDFSKNLIDPSQISPANSKKIWWKCDKGHEWEATIGSRTSSNRPGGCPYCSNPPKKILVGFNDFESWCIKHGKETLIDEWNQERNKGIDPKSISYGSGKRVWWKCNRGHEWCTSVADRARGTGCPVCSRTQTSFPEQAIAFYLSHAFQVLQRYHVKGYEIDIFLEDYGIGIEYDGMQYHTKETESREHDKDVFFNNKGITLIHVKENTSFVGIKDDTVFYIPTKKKYLNSNFNEMLQMLLTLIENHINCTIDMDIDVVRDELAIREHYASIIERTSVAAIYPELVSEWDVEKNNGMTPNNFSANAHTKVWWRCEKGHSWQAVISSRVRGLGCPYCAGQRTIVGENDFESWCVNNNPGLLAEWNYEKNQVKPSEIAKTSNKKVWWKCSVCGYEWEATLANRTHGTKCPCCFTGNTIPRRGVSLSDWCKANGQEHLIKEWDYSKNGALKPETVSKGSHQKVWWKCDKGHEWEAQIKSRTYNHGCPYCSGTNKKQLKVKMI